MSAFSPILGRLGTGPGPLERDILEMLHAERAIPLPARYAVEGPAGDLSLHVVVGRRSAPLLSRLESQIAERNLGIKRLVLVDTPNDMLHQCSTRADLSEGAFESAAIERAMDMAGQ
jgi:hypothetical protein